MKKPSVFALAFASLLLACNLGAGEMQIRDVARPAGQRDNQLQSIGLVVGLAGTGDTQQTEFTQQALANWLSNMGVSADSTIKSRNVAVVLVSAELKPFMKNGDKMDVLVSSMGDATSLAGGTLVQVPLKGADGKVYAVAQGAISVGDQMGGRLGSLISSAGYKTAGRVPSGALIENEVPATVVGEDNRIEYILRTPDLSSAARMAMAINDTFVKLKPDYAGIATAKDAKTVDVEIPADFRDYPVEFMAAVEQVEFNPEEMGDKVVVNERTGTVVIGFKVAIDTCAVAHGNLNVNVRTTDQYSQPAWFQPGASALYYNNQNINVKGGGGNLVALPESATVQDLVSALNAVGASPRDLIAILQAIKEAGALHGDLEIL
ncbi:MAG TPA: flagellar basal body P-ring protein FlgI [bacterium]|nr:flagellar basal body P-ring protein FlgI [bacterium]